MLIIRQSMLGRIRPITDLDVVDAFAAVDIAAVCLAGFILIFSGAFGRTWSSLRRTPAMWLAGYYVFCAVSCLWSAKPVFSLYRAFEYLILLSATLAAVAQYRDFAGAERAFCRIAMAAIILDIYATIWSYGLSSVVWHNTTYTISSALLFCYCLGEYLAMTKAERFEAEKRSRRLLRFGIFAFCTLALGRSSGSSIGALVGCLLIFLALRRFWLLLIGFWVALLIFLWGAGGEFLRDLLFPGKSLSNIETGSGRTILWEFLWHKFLQRPFLGYGFGLVGIVSGGMASHSHNSLFTVLIGTGSVGVVLFAIFAVRLWWTTISKVWRRGPGTVGFAGALAAFFVNSLSSNVMADRWITSSVVFVWLLGLFLLHTRDHGSTTGVSGRILHSKKLLFRATRLLRSCHCRCLLSGSGPQIPQIKR
jgi:O-antigen ligase